MLRSTRVSASEIDKIMVVIMSVRTSGVSVQVSEITPLTPACGGEAAGEDPKP